jgi:hypothetical protein
MSLAADLRALLGELGPKVEAWLDLADSADGDVIWREDDIDDAIQTTAAALLEVAQRCNKAESRVRDQNRELVTAGITHNAMESAIGYALATLAALCGLVAAFVVVSRHRG